MTNDRTEIVWSAVENDLLSLKRNVAELLDTLPPA